MSQNDILIWFISFAATSVIFILLSFTISRYRKLSEEMWRLKLIHQKVLSDKKSSEIRLGQIGEHFAPLLDDFPYDSKNARFLGSPIDFVVFDYDNDRVVLLEFKTGNSKETKKQRQIKDIVRSGNVFYEVMRVNKDVTIA